MSKALAQVTQDALNLSPSPRLALVEILLESTDTTDNPEVEMTWEHEIRAWIRAVDEGNVSGVPYEDVRQAAKKLLSR